MIYLRARFFFGERELGVCEKVAEIQYAGRKERENQFLFSRKRRIFLCVYESVRFFAWNRAMGFVIGAADGGERDRERERVRGLCGWHSAVMVELNIGDYVIALLLIISV